MPHSDTTVDVSGRSDLRLRNAVLALTLLAACVTADQLTKRWATASLQDSAPQSFLGDSVRLQYALNSGGFLSFGSELSDSARFGIFVGFNLVLMSGLGWFLCSASSGSRALYAGVALLFAGGVGNLIDRITQNGHVIDFMNLGVGSLRTGIFNVADVAIVAGALLVAGASWTATSNAAEPSLSTPPA